MTNRFERQQIDRALIFLDIAVVLVFLVSLTLLVFDAYGAGFYEAAANDAAHSTTFWHMVRDIAFVMISLGYFVTRHFKVALTRATSPWA
ncbi:MAG: hypothetical protein ACYDDF_08410 [Thermoplasmatota archaeon]